MPIRDYTCSRCGNSFEELIIRSSDEETVACPKCGSAKVERCISRTAPTPGGSSRGRATNCGPVG